MYNLVRTVAPVDEPVTNDDLVAHMRLDDTSEKSLLDSLRKAARMECEKYKQMSLLTQTWQVQRSSFPGGCSRGGKIHLPMPPLQAVISVVYIDLDGAEQALAEDTDFVVDSSSLPPFIVPQVGRYWPISKDVPGSVKVTYRTGYDPAASPPAEVPENDLLGIKMLAAYWYENREAQGSGLPDFVKSLWSYGVIDFAAED